MTLTTNTIDTADTSYYCTSSTPLPQLLAARSVKFIVDILHIFQALHIFQVVHILTLCYNYYKHGRYYHIYHI